MTGRELVGVLVARRVPAAAAALLGLVATLAVSFTGPEVFVARSAVTVTAEDPARDLRFAYYAEELVEGNYNPYADFLATWPRPDGAELRSSAIVGTDAVVVEIAGRSVDPRRAVEVAGTAASELAAWAASPPDRSADSPSLRVAVSSPDDGTVTRAGPHGLLIGLVAAVAAVVAGLVGALLAAARRPVAGASDRRPRCPDRESRVPE